MGKSGGPSKSSGTDTCPLSPLLFNITLEVLPRDISQNKETKGMQIGKDDPKLSLFACRTLSMGEPKDSTKRLLELITEFSKVAGYKTNTQKSMALTYTKYFRAEKETWKIFPIHNCSRKTNIPWNKFNH